MKQEQKQINVAMAGVDHSVASIACRERFAFTKSGAAAAMKKLLEIPGISGCLLLSTCNRTELWISGEPEKSPFALLSSLKGIDEEQESGNFVERRGEEAVWHLLELSCGLKSRVFGEDQIVTQVREALSLSRNCGAADSVIETLFRTAVTAAKRIKTQVRLTAVDHSVARRAVERAEEFFGSLQDVSALVIGNGEMGRLSARLLVEKGCKVRMTLRRYKSGDAVIPAGCRVVDYENRLDYLGRVQLVVSATTSPHYTLTAAQLAAVQGTPPRLMLDLAVPRDFEPAIAENRAVTLLDVDSFGAQMGTQQAEEVERARGILAQSFGEFLLWYHFREFIPLVQRISRRVGVDALNRTDKTVRALRVTQDERDELRYWIEHSAEKAVARLLFGLREELDAAYGRAVWRDWKKRQEKRENYENLSNWPWPGGETGND